MITLDSVLFIAYPYVSIVVLLVGTIYRYTQRRVQHFKPISTVSRKQCGFLGHSHLFT
jgi:nitrate reductase gamma subunit